MGEVEQEESCRAEEGHPTKPGITSFRQSSDQWRYNNCHQDDTVAVLIGEDGASHGFRDCDIAVDPCGHKWDWISILSANCDK